MFQNTNNISFNESLSLKLYMLNEKMKFTNLHLNVNHTFLKTNMHKGFFNVLKTLM
jgi:hypothetical protein